MATNNHSSCLFCRIAAGQSPAQVEYSNPDCTVFWDIKPSAAVHLLVVSKRHIPSLVYCEDTDKSLLGSLLLTAKEVAHRKGLDKEGYRLVINSGISAGQVVDHLHVHILGGEPLGKMTRRSREIVP